MRGAQTVKALVLYSKSEDVKSLAMAVAQGLEEAALPCRPQRGRRPGHAHRCGGYDVVCVGSPVIGFWGGQIAPDVDASRQTLHPPRGKQAAVFVKSKAFGTR